MFENDKIKVTCLDFSTYYLKHLYGLRLPHLLRRPVVTPTSPPISCSVLPTSPICSVGNGPPPTRVVYDLTTPMMFWISNGLRARPEMHPLKNIRARVAFLWNLMVITLWSNCSMCRMESCRNPRQEAMPVSFRPKWSAYFLA